MSWTGIKKAINRAGTQVMLKTGQIDRSVDKEYEFEEKRFKAMEKASLKLHTELRHYLESLRIVTTSQVNVSESILSFYGIHEEGDKPRNLAQEYFKDMKKFEATTRELEQPYNQTVLNPLGRFNSYYVEINAAIKKRLNKQLDYDAMKNKVKKLIEKPNTNDPNYETKLQDHQAQLVERQEAFDALNDQLKKDLPKFMNLRSPFLSPSFEAFVKVQLQYFNENYKTLEGLLDKLDARTREDYITGKIDKRIDDVLVKMRELNITGV